MPKASPSNAYCNSLLMFTRANLENPGGIILSHVDAQLVDITEQDHTKWLVYAAIY